MTRKNNFRIVRGKALPRCLHRKVHEPTTHEKQRTLPFLSSQDAESNRLKSPRASARDAKLSTYNRAHTNDEDGTIALFTFVFIEEEGALLLGKTIQKNAH